MEQTIHKREELSDVLADITMTNTSLDFNWHFQVQDCNDPALPGWFIRVGFERPDTNTGEIGIGYGRWEHVAAGASISGAVKTAWLLIELVVRHELMEAFRWKDKRIFNPHNTIESLASIQV